MFSRIRKWLKGLFQLEDQYIYVLETPKGQYLFSDLSLARLWEEKYTETDPNQGRYVNIYKIKKD